MKKIYLITLTALALAATLQSCKGKAESFPLNDERDSLSWAMGMSLAQTAQSNFYDFDKEIVLRAFESYLNKEDQPLNTDQYNLACQQISQLATLAGRQSAQQQSAQSTERQEKLFAQLTAENPAIKQAPEGFYYEVLREGKGPKATLGKRVKFDFKGSNLYSGELIEQTYGKRDAIVHVLGKPMFEGLIEGMQLMNEGSKYRFYFPYQKVVGANGIPPYTPVVYEIELHNIFND